MKALLWLTLASLGLIGMAIAAGGPSRFGEMDDGTPPPSGPPPAMPGPMEPDGQPLPPGEPK